MKKNRLLYLSFEQANSDDIKIKKLMSRFKHQVVEIDRMLPKEKGEPVAQNQNLLDVLDKGEVSSLHLIDLSALCPTPSCFRVNLKTIMERNISVILHSDLHPNEKVNLALALEVADLCIKRKGTLWDARRKKRENKVVNHHASTKISKGLVQARENGVKLGRKSIRCSKQDEQVLALRRQGLSLRSIVKRTDYSLGLVSKVINEHKE